MLKIKRLERGRFQLAVVDEKRVKIEMEATELAMLLDGSGVMLLVSSSIDSARHTCRFNAKLPLVSTA